MVVDKQHMFKTNVFMKDGHQLQRAGDGCPCPPRMHIGVRGRVVLNQACAPADAVPIRMCVFDCSGESKGTTMCVTFHHCMPAEWLNFFILRVFLHISAYFINGGENAHFSGPMRTKCRPKYQKSPQCGPKASFADLFGNTALG